MRPASNEPVRRGGESAVASACSSLATSHSSLPFGFCARDRAHSSRLMQKILNHRQLPRNSFPIYPKLIQGKTALRGPSSLFGVRRIPQRRREEPDTLRAAFHSALRRRASGKNGVKHSFRALHPRDVVAVDFHESLATRHSPPLFPCPRVRPPSPRRHRARGFQGHCRRGPAFVLVTATPEPIYARLPLHPYPPPVCHSEPAAHWPCEACPPWRESAVALALTGRTCTISRVAVFRGTHVPLTRKTIRSSRTSAFT